MVFERNLRIGVLGAGAFGTALGINFAHFGHEVTLSTTTDEHLAELNDERENLTFLKGYKLKDNIDFSLEIPSNLDILFCVAPAQKTYDVVARLKVELDAKIPVVFCSKGILQNNNKNILITEIAENEILNPLFVLSGPNFAHELASLKKSEAQLGSKNNYLLAKQIATALSSESLKIFPSNEFVSMQIAGAYKNIIAIAAGIIREKNVGQNFMATLFVKAINEMYEFGKNRGVQKTDFLSLSGVGDLILTCSSDDSRNSRLGRALSKGIKFEDYIKETKAVAEGAYTAKVVFETKHNLWLPICEFVYDVLYRGKNIDEGLLSL